jgi:hypothetical protein
MYEVWVLLSHFAAIVLPERDVEFEGGINCFEPNRQYVPPLPPLYPPPASRSRRGHEMRHTRLRAHSLL